MGMPEARSEAHKINISLSNGTLILLFLCCQGVFDRKKPTLFACPPLNCLVITHKWSVTLTDACSSISVSTCLIRDWWMSLTAFLWFRSISLLSLNRFRYRWQGFLLSMEVTCSQATLAIMGLFVDHLVSWCLSSAGGYDIERYRML